MIIEIIKNKYFEYGNNLFYNLKNITNKKRKIN